LTPLSTEDRPAIHELIRAVQTSGEVLSGQVGVLFGV
jgi:hypothetical protein